MEAGGRRRCSDERIGNLHRMRLRVSREVGARSAPGRGIEHDVASRFEERLGDRLLAGPDAGKDLRPCDCRTVGRHARALEGERGFYDGIVPAKDLDDDVRIVEDAA